MSNPAYSLLHPGVQKAIFQRGWKELHPIQVKAIQWQAKENGHLLICAQTAGGKTEAAFLPIISALAANPRPSVQALYVGPLVALINDQFSRLEMLCADMEVPVHRWHGAASATEKRRFRDAPGGILLITPESLESNFINYGSQIRRLYADLEYVVIDELHSFLSDVRGIHLRSLLMRLFAEAGRSPRIIGLSATLGDPQGARSFLSEAHPEAVSIIESKGEQAIAFGIKGFLRGRLTDDERIWRWQVSDALKAALRMTAEKARETNPFSALEENIGAYFAPHDELDDIATDIIHTCSAHTNLVFGNAKQGLEILADRLHAKVRKLSLARDPFHIHHGSLSKEVRLEAEEILKSGQPATVLCSGTLEMGIDIGSVRRVGQLDPPWSVASLRQRLGRSGRREGEPARMCVYSRDASPDTDSSLTDLLYPNLIRTIALARLMLERWIEPHQQNQLHLSTLVHQILSCLRQSGGLRYEALYSRLVMNGAFTNVSSDMFEMVIIAMRKTDLIEQMPQGELILGLGGERVTSDRDFYAAFMAGEEFVVRHDGKEIGKLLNSLVPPVGDNLILGGRRWQVNDIDPIAKTIFVTPSRGGKPPYFRGTGGETHNRVMAEMKFVLSERDEPSYVDAAGLKLLEAARKIARIADIIPSGVIVRSSSIQWFPWIGTRALRALELCATCAEISAETDELSITYKNIDEATWKIHLEFITKTNHSALELARHMKIKGFEKFDSVLPDELLDHANALRSIDLFTARSAAEKLIQQ